MKIVYGISLAAFVLTLFLSGCALQNEAGLDQNGAAVDEKIAHDVTRDYTQFNISFHADSTTVYFQPIAPIQYVILHYEISGHPQENIVMTSTYGRYVYSIPASQGVTIRYSFTYNTGGVQYDTQWYTVGDTSSISAGVVKTAENSAKITFSRNPQAEYVIAHYIVDNGPQMNVMMNKIDGVYELALNGIGNAEAVSYSFTFAVGGLQYDTETTVYTFVDRIAPTVPVIQSVYYNNYGGYFSLSWFNSADNVAVSHYRLYNGDVLLKDNIKGNYAKYTQAVYISAKIFDLGMAPYQTYDLNFRAVDTSGNVSVPVALTNLYTSYTGGY